MFANDEQERQDVSGQAAQVGTARAAARSGVAVPVLRRDACSAVPGCRAGPRLLPRREAPGRQEQIPRLVADADLTGGRPRAPS